MKKRLVILSAEGPDGVRFSSDTRGGVWIAARTASGALACVQVSAADWVSMLEGIRVEDVPEPRTPGQRLYEELRTEDDALWGVLTSDDRTMYERHARNLGIEPEGE